MELRPIRRRRALARRRDVTHLAVFRVARIGTLVVAASSALASSATAQRLPDSSAVSRSPTAPEQQSRAAGLPPDAAALLRQSIAAHGSKPARLRLVYRGAMASPNQSATPEGPFRRLPWTVRIAIDENAGAISYDPDLAIDGDFHFRNPVGFAAGRGFALAYTGDSYTELTALPAVADAYLPHRQLQEVLTKARTGIVTRAAGYDRLTYATPSSGETRTLLFDERTHLLAAVQRPPVPTIYGDQTRETTYGQYRRIAGTMVPGSVIARLIDPIHGKVEREMRLAEGAPGGPDTAELTPPPGAVRREPEPRLFETVPLGRDTYLLRNTATAGPFSYNILAVVFEDHVLIVEAALDEAATRRVIETVATLAPGKAIRMLVQTHHHSDHIGGIRGYIANGTTIVAPEGTRRLIDRIATTHSVLAPDTLARTPKPARVEEVRGERIIRDARNEVRLYDVPSDHSAHMLVVYLPEQRVLYQGDLVSAGELPLNATSRRFLAWLRGRRLDVATLAGVHGRPVEGPELQLLLTDERLLAPSGRTSGPAKAGIP